MGKAGNLTVLGVIIGVFALGTIFFITHFEIYDRTISRPPSREAEANHYLAMERWLTETGRPARTLAAGKAGDFAGGKRERVVFLHASSFDWRGAGAILAPWAASGGTLVAALDTPWYEKGDEELLTFLRSFGVRRHGPDSEAEDENPPADRESGRGGASTAFSVVEYSGAAVDQNAVFSVRREEVPPSVDKAALYEDSEGRIKLVTLYIGAGSITITGIPYFMYSDRLDAEENARLAWELLGSPPEAGEGVLFIRGKKRVKSFWGKLADRGNPIPLGVSCGVLLIIGFWAVIPVFGFLLDEPTEPGASIRERFRSEARFLRKHRALGAYIEVYKEEINRQDRAREALGPEERTEIPYQRVSAGFFLKEVRRLSERANAAPVSGRR